MDSCLNLGISPGTMKRTPLSLASGHFHFVEICGADILTKQQVSRPLGVDMTQAAWCDSANTASWKRIFIHNYKQQGFTMWQRTSYSLDAASF